MTSCNTYYVASSNTEINMYGDANAIQTIQTVPVGSVLLLKGKSNSYGLRKVRYHNDKTWYYTWDDKLTLVPGFNPKSYDYTYSSYERSGVTTTNSSGYNATIQTGSRGGKYYINKNGNKTYVKRSTPSGSVKRVGGTGSRGGRKH
ncbi:hypothetical protein [Mucilaginibacter sp. HD30]